MRTGGWARRGRGTSSEITITHVHTLNLVACCVIVIVFVLFVEFLDPLSRLSHQTHVRISNGNVSVIFNGFTYHCRSIPFTENFISLWHAFSHTLRDCNNCIRAHSFSNGIIAANMSFSSPYSKMLKIDSESLKITIAFEVFLPKFYVPHGMLTVVVIMKFLCRTSVCMHLKHYRSSWQSACPHGIVSIIFNGFKFYFTLIPVSPKMHFFMTRFVTRCVTAINSSCSLCNYCTPQTFAMWQNVHTHTQLFSRNRCCDCVFHLYRHTAQRRRSLKIAIMLGTGSTNILFFVEFNVFNGRKADSHNHALSGWTTSASLKPLLLAVAIDARSSNLPKIHFLWFTFSHSLRDCDWIALDMQFNIA